MNSNHILAKWQARQPSLLDCERWLIFGHNGMVNVLVKVPLESVYLVFWLWVNKSVLSMTCEKGKSDL